jgi:hypothetical protein
MAVLLADILLIRSSSDANTTYGYICLYSSRDIPIRFGTWEIVVPNHREQLMHCLVQYARAKECIII